VFVSDKTLSDECYGIILKMHHTGAFKSRAPNKDKPTLMHLAVQAHLMALFNGSFVIGLAQGCLGTVYPMGYCDCLRGSWTKIEKAVLATIPEGMVLHIDMEQFFWSVNTHKSWFLSRVNIHAYDAPEATALDISSLKQQEVPEAMTLCSEILCPKAEVCIRIRFWRGKGKKAYSARIYTSDGCKDFREE
jgi:hypothetical protein